MQKELVTLKLKDLKPYWNNPRKNKKAIKPVAESIRQTGYNNPIVVDEENVILAGHTRLESLSSLGIKEAQVIRVSGLTEEKKKKFRLLDNKIGEISTWDFSGLLEELQGLNFQDMEIDWGLDAMGENEPETETDKDGEKYDYQCPYCGFQFNAEK